MASPVAIGGTYGGVPAGAAPCRREARRPEPGSQRAQAAHDGHPHGRRRLSRRRLPARLQHVQQLVREPPVARRVARVHRRGAPARWHPAAAQHERLDRRTSPQPGRSPPGSPTSSKAWRTSWPTSSASPASCRTSPSWRWPATAAAVAVALGLGPAASEDDDEDDNNNNNNTVTSPASPLKFSALIGVDPVAGLSKALQLEPKVLTFKPRSLDPGMPALVIGTGLGPKHVGLLPCAPAGVNHAEFYDECVPPRYHVVVRDYGHLDMLDDDGVPYVINNCMCKRNTKDTKDLARRAIGGAMVAFLRATLEEHGEDLEAVLENSPGLSPAVLDPVEHDLVA